MNGKSPWNDAIATSDQPGQVRRPRRRAFGTPRSETPGPGRWGPVILLAGAVLPSCMLRIEARPAAPQGPASAPDGPMSRPSLPAIYVVDPRSDDWFVPLEYPVCEPPPPPEYLPATTLVITASQSPGDAPSTEPVASGAPAMAEPSAGAHNFCEDYRYDVRRARYEACRDQAAAAIARGEVPVVPADANDPIPCPDTSDLEGAEQFWLMAQAALAEAQQRNQDAQELLERIAEHQPVATASACLHSDPEIRATSDCTRTDPQVRHADPSTRHGDQSPATTPPPATPPATPPACPPCTCSGPTG
jgi:hypothetical protein